MLRTNAVGTNGSKPDIFAAEKNPFFTTLVADSKAGFDPVLEDFLKAEKHFVLRSATAEDALAKTLKYQPDLILLDNALEGKPDLSLLTKLLRTQVSAAVIILARNASIPESVEALRLGAVDYLSRPFDLSRLKLDIDTQKDLFKN